MIQKLRRRFVIITMSIVTIMLVIIFGLVLSLTHKRILEDNLRMLINVASSPIGADRPFQPGRRQDDNIKLPFFRVVVDKDGKILATDGNAYDLTDEDNLHTIVQEALQGKRRSGELLDYNLRYLRARTDEVKYDIPSKETTEKTQEVQETQEAQEKQMVGQAEPENGKRVPEEPEQVYGDSDHWDGSSNRVIVFSDISSERSTMRNLIRNCVLIGLLSFLVFLVITIYFARWTVKPVEDAWNQQRQFVSDASHELKTPLTVILTNAELLKGNEFSEERKAQFTESILTMAHQMRGLVDSLLQLARVDNGAIQKMELERVPLSQLCEDEMLTFEVLFFEKGLELVSELEPDIFVKGARQHLKQVIEILLDNAQKYADAKGKVTMKLTKGNHMAVLSVSDPGEALSEEERKNIFKRFYRVDEARAMNHSYGLGLSIAESIVTNHHGRIYADSKDGYNIFTVELPLA